MKPQEPPGGSKRSQEPPGNSGRLFGPLPRRHPLNLERYSISRIPFGDHPFNLERYRED